MKAILILSLILVAGFATSVDFEELKTLWGAWKSMYGKTYAVGEDDARFAIFVENYKKVLKFNAENETPKLGLNVFADMTAEEFKSQKSGCAFVEDNEEYVNANTVVMAPTGPLPASVDWRTKGAVTPIKNQGSCGSCWSFSTTGVLEGFNFIKSGTLTSFSEQQIVDCDNNDYGCDGGWPYDALLYAAANGLETESEYPYTGEDGTCKYNKNNAQVVNTGYSFILKNNRIALKTAIVLMPVSVLIEADQDVFQLYTSGVITTGCGASLDHAVLAVGYNTANNQEYYIVKNSWGTSWGQQGYVYISTDPTQNSGSGVCGILSQPVIPTKSS